MSTQSIPGIRFGPFFLDTAGRRLILDGRRVPLGPLELKLLETLLRNRERVLTGDELRIMVWADDPTRQIPPAQEVNALYVAVRKLRTALGEYGKWVVNIPKVGYTVSEEADVVEITGAAAEVPEHLAGFVGRKAEVANAREMLKRSRLLTLTGPPGIGKSRLAREISAGVAKNYPNGVCVVDFVPIEDEVFVPKTVLTALGLAEQAGRTVEEDLREYLKDKHMLLLLDNCEHVIEACSALVENLFRASRSLQAIATSREALRIPSETVLVVPPLSVPAEEKISGAEDVTRYEAVELFVELAKQQRPGFELGKRNMAAVAELCRQLEGIPVAIELAAVQVDAYTVEQILAMTADRFRMLRRRGGETSRHQTLESAIDWSYGLLSEEERMLLRRLSVFAGGWTAETAKEVCAGEGVRESDVVHLLARLVRGSLIYLGGRKGFHRYQMLEMIRNFSRERLREAGEEAQLLERHSRAFLKLAERAFEQGEKGDLPELLEAEYDNLRAALMRNIGEGKDIESGLRMCGALVRFWFNHGHISEAHRWTKRALEIDDGRYPAARAQALVTAGFFFGQMAGSAEDSERGREYFEESLNIWRRLGNKKGLAFTLNSYAFLLNRHGEFERALDAAKESLTIFRLENDPINISRAANNLALNHLDLGEFEKGLPLFKESLAAAQTVEDRYMEAILLHNLGDLALLTGQLDEADRYLTSSLTLFKPLGHRPLVARTLLLQGEAIALRGNLDEALAMQRVALSEFREMGDNQGIATALEAIACAQSERRDQARLVLNLYGAAAGLREKIKLRLGPARLKLTDRCMKLAQSAVGDEVARLTVEEGRAMRLEKAIEMALADE